MVGTGRLGVRRSRHVPARPLCSCVILPQMTNCPKDMGLPLLRPGGGSRPICDGTRDLQRSPVVQQGSKPCRAGWAGVFRERLPLQREGHPRSSSVHAEAPHSALKPQLGQEVPPRLGPGSTPITACDQLGPKALGTSGEPAPPAPDLIRLCDLRVFSVLCARLKVTCFPG